MFLGTGIKEVKRSSGFSIWIKQCHCCERTKLLKHFPWYPMKVWDSMPRVMDVCVKCARVLGFRMYNPKDYSPDISFLNAVRDLERFYHGDSEASNFDDRHKFNLGEGRRWTRAK